MLSPEDNEILCRVSAGTPMGDLFRLYWLPAFTSNELPSPDCNPMRVRLLGENLIAFRASSGKVGLLRDACPHRGASLFYGRNEEEGLRCVYHGWKFDTAGACVDMPSEPPESNFRSKVRATGYPCQERNGIVWTYMGPATELPPLPDIEANMVSDEKYAHQVLTIMRECNYMQGLEGDIDTVHSNFLHDGSVKFEDLDPGTNDYYRRATLAPKFAVSDAPIGTIYAASTPAEADSTYWRIATFLLPFYTQTPSGVLGGAMGTRAWVPIDDENTMFWRITARERDAGESHPTVYRSRMRVQQEQVLSAESGNAFLPNTSDWLGRWRLVANEENDYMIDREAQRNMVNYTGIATIFLQDQAVTESMGRIYKRSKEHLGTSDSMIIRTRRRLIKAAVALRESGELPPGVTDAELYAIRSGWVVLPNGVDWLEGTEELRKAFVERPAEELSAHVPLSG